MSLREEKKRKEKKRGLNLSVYLVKERNLRMRLYEWNVEKCWNFEIFLICLFETEINMSKESTDSVWMRREKEREERYSISYAVSLCMW